jgi:hypothetical protein
MIKFVAGFLIVISLSLVFARVPIVTWALQRYAKNHKQDLQFEITSLTLSEFTLKNVRLNSKNVIPLLRIHYKLWDSDFLKKIQLDVDTLNAESLQDTFTQLASNDSETSEPAAFDESLALCRKFRKIDLQVQWRELVVGTQKIPFQLGLKNDSKQLQLKWDDQKNSKGLVTVNCEGESIQMSSSSLNFEVKDTVYKDMKIENFSIGLHDSALKWLAGQPLNWRTEGAVSAHYTQAQHTYIWALPTVEFSGLYNFDGSISGKLRIPKMSLGFKEKGDQVAGVELSGTFLKDAASTKALLQVRDKTRELFIDDVEITQEPEALRIKTDIAKTKIKFNSQLSTLVPDVKKWLTALSGTLRLGSDITYQNEKLSGTLHVIGENLTSQSDFGDYEGVSFNHKISSLDSFATPDRQSLKIKKINLGPGVEDLNVTYQMPNMFTVEVRQFSARAGKGELYAENFIIYPQKKRIEKFLAQVVNVDLETLLAVGLKDTIKAQGLLHGHLGVSYQGTRPVFKGLLTDPKPGWIQYRTGNTQASGISLSDGPMEILNNYLYDFQYQNLSLTISSDTNYDMKVNLAALGHNPNYLNGKPLKLNVNLEQNLLAAMQSIMLTYDLPNRIREKLEKVNE